MAQHKDQVEPKEMINLASLLWGTLCEHLVVFTNSFCLDKADNVAIVTHKLRATTFQMLEGGELTPMSWVVPYSKAQMGVLRLGEERGLLTLEEMIKHLLVGYWIIKGTTPGWTKELFLGLIRGFVVPEPNGSAQVKRIDNPSQAQELCQIVEASSSQRMAKIRKGKKPAPVSPQGENNSKGSVVDLVRASVVNVDVSSRDTQ